MLFLSIKLNHFTIVLTWFHYVYYLLGICNFECVQKSWYEHPLISLRHLQRFCVTYRISRKRQFLNGHTNLINSRFFWMCFPIIYRLPDNRRTVPEAKDNEYKTNEAFKNILPFTDVSESECFSFLYFSSDESMKRRILLLSAYQKRTY